MKLATIYKRTSTGKVQEWTVEIEGDKYRTISGQQNGKKVTSEWTVAKPKNIGKVNGTTAEEQAVVEATAKRNHKLEREYREQIDGIDSISKNVKAVMLAHSFEKLRDIVSFPAYIQPKFDGIRCRSTIDGLFTRSGKTIVSSPHIHETLLSTFKSVNGLELDGELYSDKFNKDFEKILSLVNKTKPTIEDLAESKIHVEYHIYDVIGEGNYSDRYEKLIGLIAEIDKKYPKNNIRLARTIQVNNFEEIDIWYEKFLEQGYEGAILRLNKPYEKKRSKYLLKIKPEMDEEFTILGFKEGKGNKTGMAATVLCKTKEGEDFEPNVTGGDDFATMLFQNQKKFIGKKCTVIFQNYTAAGIPRFPRMKAIRDYE